MALRPGSRLGPYEILGLIGAGGMGEVYRARDTRLDRDVAIKVLPPAFTADADRRARFEREAKAIAALSHPNILAIFDTGLHEDQLFVITELLDGETLRDALRSGALPVRKSIEIAVQIARGLAAAHDKGIVHRDLKPDNIFLLRDGQVKILDFGLARSIETGGDATATVVGLTGVGTVIGTVGYMAPEQVRGLATDARTDLFALGAVLYETLSGRRAFEGDTAADTMFAIVKEDPPAFPVVSGAPAVPVALDRIVRHCLEKNPRERFQSARDVAFDLDALSGSGSADSPTASSIRESARSLRPGPALGFALGVAVSAAAVGAWLMVSKSPTTSTCGGVEPLAIGTMAQTAAGDELQIHPALSPDGKLLAYAAGSARRMRVYVRPVAGGRAIALSDSSEAMEYQPRWSPDGTEILYLTGSDVRFAPSLGGSSRRIVAGSISAAAWAPDGKRIFIARADGTMAILSVDSGNERTLGKSPHGSLQRPTECDWSQQGDRLACTFGNPAGNTPGPNFGNLSPSGVMVGSATGGSFVDVAPRGRTANSSPVWSPDGQTLYFISNRQGLRDIYAVKVPLEGTVQAVPCRITAGLGAQAINLAAGGQRLAYVAYSGRSNIYAMPIPTGGPVDASTATAITRGNQIVEAMRVSHDGRWLVYDSTLYGNSEIFRVPVTGGAVERLTIDPADDFAGDLSPDGHFVAFHSFRLGSRDIFVQPVEGGPAQAVATDPTREESYPVWSPNGQTILFVDQRETLHRFWFVRRQGSGWATPVAIANASGRGIVGSWFTDGRSFLYTTEGEIRVGALDGGSHRIVYAPTPGSSDPKAEDTVLAEDGRTCYFKAHDQGGHPSIWAVAVDGGRPRQLVRFGPTQSSVRADLAAGAGRLFFTLEDRQADIVVADLAHAVQQVRP